MKPESLSCQREFRVERLIGREAEKRNLDAALARAVKFETPQFVSLIGAAGMGKTRLCAEWLQTVDEAKQFQAFFARPHAGASVAPPKYSLISSLLRARLGIRSEDDQTVVHNVLGRELAAVFGDRRVSEMAVLIAPFLGIEVAPTPLATSIAIRKEQRTDLARAVLCRFLEEDGRKQPLLFVVDDAHLADDESLEVLAHLGRELGETSVVFVLAARPEIVLRRPEWNHVEGSQVRLELGPLSPLEMQVFIQCALSSESLPAQFIEQSISTAAGSPGIMLRLLASHAQGEGSAGDRTFAGEQVAGSIQDLIPRVAAHVESANRLDRLSSSSLELLRRAACIGPVFWTGALVSLGRLDAEPWDSTLVFSPDPSIDEVKRLLGELSSAGFLCQDIPNPLPCDTVWSFVDTTEVVMLASAVDLSLLRNRKRFAAQWIEARCSAPGTTDQLEIIARLSEEGGDLPRAGRRYIAAGDEARRTSNHDRARACYGKAVALLEPADDALLSIDTLHKAGDVCARLGRSREALDYFGRMLKTAWRLDLPGKAGAAHGRIGRIHRALGAYPLALQHLDMAHLLFDLASDRPGVAASLDDIGRVNYLVGKPDEALRCHQTALAIRTEINDERGMALTLSWIGLVEAQMGELGLAQKSFERSLAISQAKRDTSRILFSLLDLGSLAHEAGHPALARNLVEQARGLSRSMGEPLHECHLALQVGSAWLAQDRIQMAEEELLKAKEIAQKFSAGRLIAEADLGLAECELRSGNAAYARHHAREAVVAARRMGAVPLEGAALRILGQALMGGEEGMDRVEARECFERSIALLGRCHAALELSRTFSRYADFEEMLGRGEPAEQLRDRAIGIRRRAGILDAKKAPTAEAIGAQA